MTRVHLVPKGTMPATPMRGGLMPATMGTMRQPVKSISTKRTPTWLKEHQAGCGLGYRATFKQKNR